MTMNNYQFPPLLHNNSNNIHNQQLQLQQPSPFRNAQFQPPQPANISNISIPTMPSQQVRVPIANPTTPNRTRTNPINPNRSHSSITSVTPSTISENDTASSSPSSNHSSNKRSLPLTTDTIIQSQSPPTKKRKKNGTTHSKLIEEFAQRSHVRNSVNLTSYHGKKQNIKTLCPYHDMLPVINDMEKEVFSCQKENSIKKEYCNILPIIRNHCEWCCSGSPYKLECRNLLMRAKELYEYEFDFNEIALPFMNAVVLGGPNPNICIKLIHHTNPNNNAFNITFKPLQNLSLLERNDTCNVALKAISCGTFKRNLQPVPDACRITKLLDGDGCFVTVCNLKSDNNSNNSVFFKVSTCEVRQRRKLQGTDSVLGVGFDCASRLSWQKPRIYWMHQSIHTLRDKKTKKIVEKKHISNRDLRFSVLIPYGFKGSMVMYMIGIQQDKHYTVNTNIPCKRYGASGTDSDNLNGINGYNSRLPPNKAAESKTNAMTENSNNIPPQCFGNESETNNRFPAANTTNNSVNYASTRIPHPISTTMPQTTPSMTDSRNSPLSASTTTTTTATNNNHANNSSAIPPLPITSAVRSPIHNNNNMHLSDNMNDGAQSSSSSSSASSQSQTFPPPPTNPNANTNITTIATRPALFGQSLFRDNSNNNPVEGDVVTINSMNPMNQMNNSANMINPMQLNNMNMGVNMNMHGYHISNINNMHQMDTYQTQAQPHLFNIPTSTQYASYNPMTINTVNTVNTQANGPYITTAATVAAGNNTYYNTNMSNNMNMSMNNMYGVDPNGDKGKYIDDDLENGRKNYIDLLRSINFVNENYQTSASKWIRTCIERYNENEDIYHNYLLNVVQSLINNIGDDKTVRGLKRAWMSYNNIENEWSFLHMICSKNLLYLFQSVVNLLINYKHELLIAISHINKESKLRISPLYCCVISNNLQFTKYLFDYYLTNLQSQDVVNILQNGNVSNNNNNNSNETIIHHLINYNHTQTLQQLINVNASRNNQFLNIQQIQLILNHINTQNNQSNPQQNNIMDGTYSINAFSK